MEINKLIYCVLTLAMLLFASCQKENPKPDVAANADTEVPGTSETPEDPPVEETVSPLADFVGQYQLDISVDGYYVDDVEAQSQMESFSGTLSIENIHMVGGVETVDVKGSFNFSGDTQLMIYNTTGTLDAQGRLVLANNAFTAPSGVELELSYTPITLSLPLCWQSTMQSEVMGYFLRYEMSNTATKQN